MDAPNGKVAVLKWKGRNIFYRVGTSDTNIIYHVLLKGDGQGDYFVAGRCAPKTDTRYRWSYRLCSTKFRPTIS